MEGKAGAMFRHGRGAGKLLASTLGLVLLWAGAASAQSSNVRLVGNHPDEASQLSTSVAPGQTLHMSFTLALRNREQLDALLAAQQDPASPEYHRWLKPDEFTARFGPSDGDVAAVITWLEQNGFTVDSSSTSLRSVKFHSDAATAARAFAVRIAASPDGKTFANLDDPALPQELAAKVSAIGGLSNTTLHVPMVSTSAASIPSAGPSFSPQDVWNFYDYTTLESDGVVGTSSDCIALTEGSDIDSPSSITGFDSSFGLPSPTITTVLVDGVDPGVVSAGNADLEADLDIEIAHSAAPGTPIMDYVGDDNVSTSDGGAIQDAIQRAVSDDLCGEISVTAAYCGGSSTFYTVVFDDIFAQAQSQLQGVYIASGDEGAAGLVLNVKKRECVLGSSRNISEIAADPHVTAVGGTQFIEPPGGTSFIAESVWNDPHLVTISGQELKIPNPGASGGGTSRYFLKPSFQTGVTPNDKHRDIPDVAFLSSELLPGYEIFFGGTLMKFIGGTSAAAPWWAGIAALVNQEAGGGSTRVGNLNQKIYTLGAAGSAGFHDVESGNNSLHGVTGFKAVKGYDRATGWGTPDIGLLVPALAAP